MRGTCGVALDHEEGDDEEGDAEEGVMRRGCGRAAPGDQPLSAACGQLAVTRAIRTQLRRPVDNSVVDRFFSRLAVLTSALCHGVMGPQRWE
jgi:hypothetical protein